MCSIPGHADAGMKGEVMVAGAAPAATPETTARTRASPLGARAKRHDLWLRPRRLREPTGRDRQQQPDQALSRAPK